MSHVWASRWGSLDRLFCYGTLCLPEIMQSVCACVTRPDGLAASLPGYACYTLTGKHYPAIMPLKGGKVSGVLYTGLRRGQFARLDGYEGEEYRRQRVWVNIGVQRVPAWTYVLRPRYYHRLGHAGWSLEQFRHEQLKCYLANRRNSH